MVVLAILAPLTGGAVSAEPVSTSSASVNRREPQLKPSDLGDGTVDGLQYPEVTEGLALVATPEPSSSGGAQLSYPIVIPPGRGITPQLSLDYDSGGGSGWVGLGWDLSVGEISVDTRFGAPHFHQGKESESYLLNGDLLVPNATSGPWQDRVRGDRQDFTRQTETQYQQIIRHDVNDGDAMTTDDYYWEVRDKGGNIFWFGGYPDAGGPYGYLQEGGETIDRSAIVYDDRGNAVKWLLSAQRDVGVNVMRYFYETVTYARTQNGWTPQVCSPTGTVLCARHTYLASIRYTEAAEVAPDPNDPDPTNREGNAPEADASYEVRFLRESAVRPTALVRQDPVVDASGGYVDLTIDRLARIEVRHGRPLGGAPRTYDALAARYDLGYSTGAFGKTLLTTVTQVGKPVAAGGTPATCPTLDPTELVDACEVHTFRYNKDVLNSDGSYNGFADRRLWNTGEDLGDRSFLDQTVALGALGASETNSAGGRIYLGFNSLVPQKVGSFGLGLDFGGGGTDALSEWIDLNGDNLPDKVYKDGSSIKFRLNTSGPRGGTTFGNSANVQGTLPRLSRDFGINFQLSVESHIVVTAVFGIGLDVSIGDSYFSDVNGDGFPDFVSGGNVYYNHLDPQGVPTFELGSASTVVPLPADGGTPDASSTQLTQVQSDLVLQSPPIDTVRRWTAPMAGTISIGGPVQLTNANSVDGVRVAVQHNGAEIAAANLVNAATSAFSTPTSRTVAKGDQIYFRVGSVSDGRNDEVTWSPTITYTAVPGFDDVTTVPADVNGLSQTVYSASADFTLAGRPEATVVMPVAGTVQVSAEISKSTVTSDDLRLVVEHNGIVVPVTDGTLEAGFVGTRPVTVSFPVAAPVYPTEQNPNATPRQDTVEVYLAVDSPIDLTAIDWNPRLVYTAAQDADGNPIPVTDANGDPRIKLDLLPEIEQYPNRSGSSVSVPWTSTASGTYDVVATLNRGLNSPAGTVVATIKDEAGTLVGKGTVTVGSAPLGASESLRFQTNAVLSTGTEYFVDVMVREPGISDSMSLAGIALRPDAQTESDQDVAVPAELRWRGRQGIFPLAYRGWAAAGYTAGGAKATQPIDGTAFVIPESRFEGANAPTGFGDIDRDPAQPWRVEAAPGSKLEAAYAFLPVRQALSLPNGDQPVAGDHWKGPRANHAVSPQLMRTSLLGADSVALAATATGGAGGANRGVTRVGIAAPSASLAIGIGPLGGSFGVSPSFGLSDFEDMNGDGYPDVIGANSIHFTDQRGAYLPTRTSVPLQHSNQDLTFGASAGLSVNLAKFKGNSKGKTNATKGNSAGKGGDAADNEGGPTLGGGISASWTSPNTSSGDTGVPSRYNAAITKVPDSSTEVPDPSTGGTAPIQIALADVNGDGLPDKVFTTPEGVFANYNLGYGFTPQSFRLTTGGFQSMESYAGNVSFGFSTPWAEFSGGAAFNWNFDQARFTWTDVNGDGILDQVRKVDNGPPQVAFGTGSGVLSPTTYGTVESADTTLIPGGQQVSFDRGSGIGIGFDFTIYIGPVCLVACYIIINPGASFQNSVSSTQVDLEDVNGDGAADSVSTTDDDELWVRLNNAGKSNLLESVTNPLGGTVTLGYTRDGNTVAHPDSVWTMSRTTVDDGRPGDGADVQATNYTYGGLAYDRVHRQSLGYSTIVATEMNTLTGPEQPLRVTTSAFHNENVFVTGLEKSVTTSTPGGQLLRRVTTTWGVRDVRAVPVGFNVLAEVAALDLAQIGDTASVASRGRSVAPLATRIDEEAYENGALAEATYQTFSYDGLGNILEQFDAGEPEDPNDDLLATFDYTDCNMGTDPARNLSASTMFDDDARYPGGCLGSVVRPSPIWSPDLCPTWVSLPASVKVTNGRTGAGQQIYRWRDGRSAICDNASMTLQVESSDGTDPTPPRVADTFDPCGSPGLAATLLTYDSWGSYNRIVYPADAECRSYAVYYTWDPDSHGNIARTTEYDLPGDVYGDFLDGTSVAASVDANPDVRIGNTSSATFDPIAGRIASRTDENGNTIRYTYDSLARTATISSPRPEDTAPLVSFEYRPGAAGYGYAVARHLDIFNPGDTIDTYSFADGLGRTTQTKRDARLFTGATTAPLIGRTVSGASTFDPLGRVTERYYPTRDTKPTTTFETVKSSTTPQVTVYDLRDRPTSITEPLNRLTSYVYGSGALSAGGTVYATTRETAPNLRATTIFTDVRGVTQASDDRPNGVATALRTRAESDGMGQLRVLTDTAGNATTHTYDLAGRRTSSNTPDGGLVTYGYDREGKLVSKVTPNLRSLGQLIVYMYDFGRLVAVDNPPGTPDVSYTYGTKGDGLNGAGRVVREEDASRIVTNTFAASGALVQQTAEIKLNGWFNPGADKSQFRWTTKWSYDGLGRIASMVYPDGERLSYAYDAGGLVAAVTGVEDGLERVQVGVDANGVPIFEDRPRTWQYDYLKDRQYDEFLSPRFERMGNDVSTEYTLDTNTRWLNRKQSISANRSVTDTQYKEIQDLNYTYDSVGNPTEYRNALPPAVANLFAATTVQRYRYDPFERLVGASAIYDLANKRHQRYELSLTYDRNGNVTAKNQYDAVVKSPIPANPTSAGPQRGELPNAATTYSWGRTYTGPAPHQGTSDAQGTYVYDANGNLQGIFDKPRDKWVRRLEWDANDRMTLVDDDGSSTAYVYDDTGQRTIERGPNGGETAFVNPWVTTRNKNEMYKHVFIDDTRIATQRDDGLYEELKRYFLHTDLQGSTNVVTDRLGEVFQHQEYFATGETWIDENSTIFRTPYQYGGGYTDDARDIINFGARWYDPRRELMYAADPVLYEDPSAVLGQPALASAYAFAGSNPVTNVDPSGAEFFTARTAAAVEQRYAPLRKFIARNPDVAATVTENLKTRIPKFLVRRGLTVDPETDRIQTLSKLLDNKPLFEIDFTKGTIKLSLGVGKRLKFSFRDDPATAPAAPPAAAQTASGTGQVGASTGRQRAASVSVSPTATTDQGSAPPSRPRAKSLSSLGSGVARADE